MQVSYSGFGNDAHRDIAQAAFASVSMFAPIWCRHLEVCEGWEASNINTIAVVSSDDTYLKVSITLYPKWFTLSDSERVHSLRHEMIDATMLPIINVVEDFLSQFISDKVMLDAGIRMMQREKEKATESINMVIEEMLPHP